MVCLPNIEGFVKEVEDSDGRTGRGIYLHISTHRPAWLAFALRQAIGEFGGEWTTLLFLFFFSYKGATKRHRWMCLNL